MIDLKDLKEYWEGEIAKGKYQGIELSLSSVPLTDYTVLYIMLKDSYEEYALYSWGGFNGMNAAACMLYEKGIIANYKDYDEKRILGRKYYDDLIATMLDVKLSSYFNDYEEVLWKYKKLSAVIRSSGLDYDWSEELYGEDLS